MLECRAMLGYADESGEPGIKKNDNDYFVFCVVLIKNREQALDISNAINGFRRELGLSLDHEFHYSTDSKKTREEFAKFINTLNFQFINVAIKKDRYRKTASFVRMAELVLDLLDKHNLNAQVVMDTNPRLCKKLKTQKKEYNLRVSFSEKKSRGNELIQLADYVTALKTRYIKYPHRKTVVEQYGFIAKKSLDEIIA